MKRDTFATHTEPCMTMLSYGVGISCRSDPLEMCTRVRLVMNTISTLESDYLQIQYAMCLSSAYA
jgi:hypothetical protein